MTAIALGASSTARALPVRSLTIIAIALAGLWFQLSAFPNHDVAWVLWGTRRMIEGAAWGRDIIEPNPPLAWYLSMSSTWLAMKLGLPIAACFQIVIATAAIASVLIFARFLGGVETGRQDSGILLTIVAAIVLLIFPYRDFGQREHLLLIALLPYLAMTARRLEGGSVSRTLACVAGLAAGLGLALKPYFLAVPLMVEAAAFLMGRRWSFAFRAETIAMGAVILAYVTFVVVAERSYLAQVIPLAQGIYWSFDLPLAQVVGAILPPLAAALGALVLAGKRSGRLPRIAVAATVGLAIACLAQHKGYSYHQYPVWGAAALTVAAVARSVEGSGRWLIHAILAALLMIGAARTAHWWQENRPAGTRYAETRNLIDAIDRYAARGRFLVVAVHPFPAFPAALYADADWASRTNSQWFLPAVAQLRADGSDPATRAFAERHARAFILHDLALEPALVIVDTNARRHTHGPADFDFLAFYREDPRFAERWAAYREVQPVGAYRLFVRGEPR